MEILKFKGSWIFLIFTFLSMSSCLNFRFKRQATNRKVFVIPRELQNTGGQLFSVSSNLKSEPGVSYRFPNETNSVVNISIEANSGIVSKLSEFPQNLTRLDFNVEVVVNGKVDNLISVTMVIISRSLDALIFSNEPSPMWAVCPVWIRPGTVVYTVQALDLNYGATDVVYMLESGGEGKFGVDPSTGEVFIIGRQQFELDKTYTLLISGQSRGMRLTSATIGYSQALNIKIGTKEPQLFKSNVTFFENATANSVIGTIKAISFQNLPLTFSMSPSSTLFVLDSKTGTITLTKQLTWALDIRQYNFNLTITEQYTSFVTMAPFTITLLSINHPPEFAVPHYTRYDVSESFAVGTELLTMVVRDYDPGALGTLTFESTLDTFSARLNANGLVSLTLAKSLDYESVVNGKYEFNVVARDGGTPSLSGMTTVQIWVKNENNKAPVFEPANQNITIREGAGPNLLLFYIQAYDPDGDGISFSFTEEKRFYTSPDPPRYVPGNAGYFSVDPSTGAVTLKQQIVAGQNISSFNLSISITDNGSCCSTPGTNHVTNGNVIVNVYRVNTQPVFPDCRSYAPKVREDQVANNPITILNMTARDTDIGPNGDLTFQIFGDENTFFRVTPGGPRTAVLQLMGSINRDTRNILKFNETFKLPVTISVRDKGIPTLVSYCLVFVTIETINKYAPVFDYGQLASDVYIPDLRTNQKLARVFAYDRDYGVNGQVLYSMSTTASDTECSTLAVDELTGWILWKGISTATVTKMTCSIVASDRGSPALSSQTSLILSFRDDIRYKAPNWQPLNGLAIDDTSVEILENSTIDSIVTSLTAFQTNGFVVNFYIPDENLEVMNGESNFIASQTTTGSNADMNILIKKLLPEANLRPEYYLRCRAFSSTPNGELIANISRLKVNIKDVNNQVPQFLGRDSNGIYTAAVTQYSRNGDYVVTVTSVDMDRDWPNNKVTYSFQNVSDLFTIGETSGEITVQSSMESNIFDPDRKSVYELIVVVTDGAPSSKGPLPNNATVRVQVIVSGGTLGNPIFQSNFSTTLAEGQPRFTNVINATAYVPPNPSTGGISSISRYNIQQGNSLRNFAVDPDTGRIYTVKPVLKSMSSNYQLTYAVFNGLKNILSYVTIAISDANIFPPKFEQTNYIYSGEPITEKDPSSVGKTITTVSATSSSTNPIQTYTSSNPSNFAVSPSGQVTLVRALSRDSPDGFAPQQVNIMASDNLNPPSYAVVSLNLSDINDHMPLFDTCCNVGFVDENVMSANVMQLKAWDADFGLNGTVDYSIVDDPSGNFYVSPSGAVSVNQALNFENKQKYSVKVRATDRGLQRLSSDTVIDIFVKDVSEFPPSFAQTLYTISAPEELPLSSIVLSVRATDADPMDRLVYSIVDAIGSDDGKYFYVETLRTFNGSYESSTAQTIATGVIKIAQRIDYDINKKSDYSFQLVVRDSTNRMAQTMVTIKITDINDNPPVFAVNFINVTLSESTALGSEVTTVTAVDIDSGINGQFTYSVDYEQSDPRLMFKVDSSSGQVSLRSQLDYEWKSNMEVKILAIDQGTPPLTGTATLSVIITNSDDSAPALRSKLPLDPIPLFTNSKKGQTIKCLDVYDPDNNNNNNNFNFQLNCTGLFSDRCSDFVINPAGCLQTNRDDYTNLGYDNYIVPITMTKKVGGSKPTTEIMELALQNQSHGQPMAGEKKVMVMNYVGKNGGFSSIPLGNVYAVDSDAPDKMVYSIEGSPYFYLSGPNGQIWLRGNATPGEQIAKVKVTNNNYPSQPVDSSVKVNLKHVNESALKAATSLRIIGLKDARDLLQATTDGNLVLNSLSQKISSLIGENSIVEILSIWTVENTSYAAVDVLYAVHGSPYYSPEKISSLVWDKRSDIFQATKLTISMSPVDLCKSEFYNCWDLGCETRLVTDETKPKLVNTDENSFVGLTAVFQQICSCPGRTGFSSPQVESCGSNSCMNGGTCMLNNSVITCLCPVGFEGRRCQKTKVGVRDGYLLLSPLTSCEVSHLSFEFLVASDNADSSLLLYNGPISDPGSSTGTYEEVMTSTYQAKDFLLLELVQGKPRLRIDLGDGELKLGFETSTLASLNDGKWHSIDIIHSGQEIRMIVDKCGKADLTENITTSTMDTSNCEARGVTPLQRFLLNTRAPLQLGGRWDATNTYPIGWLKAGFRGCIRNLQHNGETYDLSLGSWRQYLNAQDTCPNDSCGTCPPSSTCLPNVVLGTPVCQCPAGFRGSNCDIPTTVMYFNQNGFAQWEATDEFRTALNSSYHQAPFADRLDLSFRTRQTNGILYMAESFTGLERYLLEVKSTLLSLTFDLGSGDVTLMLPNVNVSDGGWHRVHVVRYGNMVEMHLDDGEGRRYNSSLPTNQHRLLRLQSASVLGDVTNNQWSNTKTVAKNLGQTCITDVRYGGYWWPLSDSENNEPKVTARVTLVGSSNTGCSVGACSNDQCPANMICVDLWQATQCICKNYTSPFLAQPYDQCVAKSCLTSPCLNGATCVMVDNMVNCVCPPGWYGLVCDSVNPTIDESVSGRNFNLAAAIVLPIIFGLLLLLLLALLIWWCCCRRRRDTLLYDESDKDIRENVIAYDDEGAGEEDNYAFDLSRLQKSSPYDMDSMKQNQFHLTGAPAFASRGTGRPLPGDYPSVADFIADRLNDIDNNPDTLLDDSRANFKFEGRGSLAGSLSSLASSDGDRDADFDWLEGMGPRFERLADLYGEGGQV